MSSQPVPAQWAAASSPEETWGHVLSNAALLFPAERQDLNREVTQYLAIFCSKQGQLQGAVRLLREFRNQPWASSNFKKAAVDHRAGDRL